MTEDPYADPFRELRGLFSPRLMVCLVQLGRQGFTGRLVLDCANGKVLCMETTSRERFDKEEQPMRGPGNAGR
jgi:hypothetical protein